MGFIAAGGAASVVSGGFVAGPVGFAAAVGGSCVVAEFVAGGFAALDPLPVVPARTGSSVGHMSSSSRFAGFAGAAVGAVTRADGADVVVPGAGVAVAGAAAGAVAGTAAGAGLTTFFGVAASWDGFELAGVAFVLAAAAPALGAGFGVLGMGAGASEGVPPRRADTGTTGDAGTAGSVLASIARTGGGAVGGAAGGASELVASRGAGSSLAGVERAAPVEISRVGAWWTAMAIQTETPRRPRPATPPKPQMRARIAAAFDFPGPSSFRFRACSAKARLSSGGAASLSASAGSKSHDPDFDLAPAALESEGLVFDSVCAGGGRMRDGPASGAAGAGEGGASFFESSGKRGSFSAAGWAAGSRLASAPSDPPSPPKIFSRVQSEGFGAEP